MPDLSNEYRIARLELCVVELQREAKLLPLTEQISPITTTDEHGDTWSVLPDGTKQWMSGPTPTAGSTPNTQAAVPSDWQPGDALEVPTHTANPTSITRIPDYASGEVFAMVDDGSGLREVPVQWNGLGVRNVTREGL